MRIKNSQAKITLIILAYIVTLMLFCASSSPFVNTTGTDSSVYRAMGRSMLAGKVMHKDVFDNKGIYTYVINAAAVLMTGQSLLGLFIVECVFMFLCARIFYALLLFYTDEKRSFMGMQIFMFLALLRGVLEGGNLTEEYGLLFQVLSVYILVKDNGKFSCLSMFMQGLTAGIVICLRPNIVMMWGGIAIIAGYEMLRQKKFARLAGNIAAGVAGIIAGIAPALIYAVSNDAVSDVMFGTFGYNFIYIGAEKTEIPFLLLLMKRTFALIIPPGKGIAILIVSLAASCVVMYCYAKKYKDFPFTKYYFAMLIMTFISAASSGRKYGHYYESLTLFCIPFALWTAGHVKPNKYKLAAVLLMIITAAAGTRIFYTDKNVDAQKFVKYNEPYYSKNERVLVTGLNAIFYNTLGVIPQEKYFCVPSNKYSDFPDPVDSQIASILSGVNDVIIVVNSPEQKEIYPDTGKSREIQEFLNSRYDLLHYEESERQRIAMYGKKRS